MEGYEAHQTLMYAFWSYVFMEMLRTHSIAVRDLIVEWSGRALTSLDPIESDRRVAV